MFESVAEWIPNNIKASFASDSATIQEMFKSVAKRTPNNIKAPLCDTPLKNLKMAALANGYTAIQEMFEGVAERIPNNMRASFASNSTTIQETFRRVAN
eukprot:5450094-Pyramimonas_sp.AAC.1